MRSIINISLPREMVKTVDDAVEEGDFATKSEFFRHLLRLWSERELSHELYQRRKDFRNGKGRVLKSLKDIR